MLTEKKVFKSATIHKIDKVIDVLWVSQIYRDGILSQIVNFRDSFGIERKAEFLASDVPDSQAYAALAGWD